MLINLTPLDYIPWISWVVITIFQILLFRVSKGIFKFLRLTMLYLLAQSVCHLLLIIFNCNYKEFYYITTILECLMMAGLSIEIGSSLMPVYKDFIVKASPVIIAIPTFVILVVIRTNEIGKPIFIINSIRIAEISFLLSLCVLFFCMIFEYENSPTKFIARSYAVLLTMLITCTEIQLRFGFSILVRTIWPLSWLIGLAGLYFTLHRCRNKGDVKISYS